MTPHEQEIRDAGRGHLIPNYELWDVYGDEPFEDDDRDVVDADIESEHGSDE